MAKDKKRRLKAPNVCPVCGEDVPLNALACPECGADHNSGWREDAEAHEALDLPEEDFDYNEFIQREFGPSFKPAGVKLIWWITAIVILVVSVVIYLFATR
jgi:hypothetical protein